MSVLAFTGLTVAFAASLVAIPDHPLGPVDTEPYCIQSMGKDSVILLDHADRVTFEVVRDFLLSNGHTVDDLYMGCE